jgi:alginate O-acetyltransferase complex protein AlgI
MGFRFKRNFNMPYLSVSITDFWQRWHISLSTWLRDYLYIPLGGNRLGPARTYVNLFLVMLLGGLWHGANWTFVLWGAWHGAWLAAERYLGIASAKRSQAFAVPFTMLIVLLGWVMFRAANVSEAMNIYGGMIGLNGTAASIEFLANVSAENLAFMAFAILLILGEPHFKNLTDAEAVSVNPGYVIAPDGSAAAAPSLVYPVAMSILFAVTVARLSEQSASPFLYFQF